MRIGQLARKIGVQPSQIISFLQKEKLHNLADYNTKISENNIAQIQLYFGYQEQEKSVGEQHQKIQSETTTSEDIQQSSLTTESELPKEKVLIRGDLSTIPSSENETNEENHLHINNESTPQDDVIRAQKVKLEGIKIIGKIDLPSQKEKESKAKEKSQNVEKINTLNHKNRNRVNNNYKKKKQTLSLEQKLEIEQKEYDSKKRLKNIEEKKERAKRYKTMMLSRKYSEPRKKKRKSEVQETNYLEAKYADRPAPATFFGKFIRWFNT